MGFYVRLANTEGQSGFYYPEKILTREQIIGFWEHASDDAKREIRGMVGIWRCSRNRRESS